MCFETVWVKWTSCVKHYLKTKSATCGPFFVSAVAYFKVENQQEEANYMGEHFNCYGPVYLEWTFFKLRVLRKALGGGGVREGVGGD